MYDLFKTISNLALSALAGCLVIGAASAQEAGGGASDLPPAHYTDEQAERGENAFLTNCSGCHGYGMIDIFADYENADTFHSKISLTMPWEDPASLPDQFYIDMVAYLLRENGHPSGDAELEINREVLRSIIPGALRDE